MHCEKNSWGLRDQAIADQLVLGPTINSVNDVGVNLAQRDERPQPSVTVECSQFREEGFAILLNVRA